MGTTDTHVEESVVPDPDPGSTPGRSTMGRLISKEARLVKHIKSVKRDLRLFEATGRDWELFGNLVGHGRIRRLMKVLAKARSRKENAR